MREISNNVIAILTVVLVMAISFELTAYQIRYQQITAGATSAIGFVGLCVDNSPLIIPIGDQIAYIHNLYTYDVNTTVANDANVTFYDNTGLFNINSATGLISFMPQDADEGVYYVNISVVSNCGRLSDFEVVKFTLRHGNRDPVLDYIPDQSINQSDLFVYDVNATDPDNDTLSFGSNSTMFQIDSDTGMIYFAPRQQDVGNHSIIIWVTDGYGGVDWQIVNFEIIDVNDPPVLQRIGSRTAIINETFELKINATDVDVKPEWNNLTFYDNATFFDINSSTGWINFTPSDQQNGTYWINISVTDDYFWDWEVISFSVVPMNHPPNITSWYPFNDTVFMEEGQSQYFNITKYDPDGTIPSSQWYLDTRLLTGENADEYTYYPGYTDAGTHNVTVVISDGELADSHEWIVKVIAVPPPFTVGGPSGGQARPPPCSENWRCSEWSVCPAYGIQTRVCSDVNNCGTIAGRPVEQRRCIYTPQPNCNDSILNCHDGGCEMWIDCGGPCKPCATCSDRIKNCHTLPDGRKICEEGIDCGGPCPLCGVQMGAVCGNAVCEEGEVFSCLQDCGLFFGQFIMAVIILAGVSIFAYRTSAFIFMIYRKKRPLPYTNLELIGAQTLRKIHLIQLEIGKKRIRTIVFEFSGVMREFFAKAFEIRRKFTYIELAEVARKRKIEKGVADRISEFCIKMTEIEYRTEEPSITDVSSAIKNAIYIVEKICGIKIHESLDKKAEEELKKIQPKENEVKLQETRQEDRERKYPKTKEEAESVKTLEKLITDGEWAISRGRMGEAEKIYSQIRELYDSINPEIKKEMYSETIRIIKMYNTIMKEMK